ncbi:hypothetical protein SAY86_001479 [Trapa natans]|uniref:Uncharacterized protein n=1 Tax=Trapa natans TaxID=22666 RepID=A0AAN7MGL2_TRANT|nr:hypothetical protein SAY86_001479 [Trapa natans]
MIHILVACLIGSNDTDRLVLLEFKSLIKGRPIWDARVLERYRPFLQMPRDYLRQKAQEGNISRSPHLETLRLNFTTFGESELPLRA